MSSTTTNYNLKKPDETDFYNIDDFNGNVDTIDAALAAKSDNDHTHSAEDVTSGTLNIARIPTGTTSSTVALGDHTHSAEDVTSGSLALERIPTGTTSNSVALGNHTHSAYAASSHVHKYVTSGDAGWAVTTQGTLMPTTGSTNGSTTGPNLGTSSYRIGTIYANTGVVDTSDRRLKCDIENINNAKEFILALKPREYKRVDGQSGRTHYGFIAQEVKEALTAAGIADNAVYIRGLKDSSMTQETAGEDDVVYGIRYAELIAPLIATVQYQAAKIEELTTRIFNIEVG